MGLISDHLGGLAGLDALQQALQNQYAAYNGGGWCTTTAGTATQTYDLSLLQGAVAQRSLVAEKRPQVATKREDGPAVQWLDSRVNEMRVRL